MSWTRPAALLPALLLPTLVACGPGLTRVWEVGTGDYSQTPAVAPDGTLITYSYDTFGGDIRYAGYARGDGAEVWSHNHEWGHDRAKSLDADGNLIVNGRDRVYGLDPADGSEAWSVDDPGVGYIQAVDGDRLYLMRQDQGASNDFKLVAIAGGEVEWTVILPELISSIAVGADGTLYAAGNDLTAYTADGDVEWTAPLQANAYFAVPAGDQLLIATPTLAAVDAADGAERWSSEVSVDREPAVAADGTIYVSNGGEVAAVDGDSGDVRWTVPMNAGPLALGADGRLYSMAMLPEDEELPELGSYMHFVVIATSDGEILWQEKQNEAVEALNHAPTFDGERVYFGGGYFLAHVYAFKGGPGLAAGPWPRTGGDNGYRYKEQ